MAPRQHVGNFATALEAALARARFVHAATRAAEEKDAKAAANRKRPHNPWRKKAAAEKEEKEEAEEVEEVEEEEVEEEEGEGEGEGEAEEEEGEGDDDEEGAGGGEEVVSEAGGLRLHLSARSQTGYRGVRYEKPNGKFAYGRYRTRFGGTEIGVYDSAVEAAVAYAKATEAERASTGGDGEGGVGTGRRRETPLSAEVMGALQKEACGVRLHLCAFSVGGYKGVQPSVSKGTGPRAKPGGFRARYLRTFLGTYKTDVAAAVAYARYAALVAEGGEEHAQRQKSKWAADESGAEVEVKEEDEGDGEGEGEDEDEEEEEEEEEEEGEDEAITSSEALRAAQAEGLQLERSERASSGFKGVVHLGPCKNGGREWKRKNPYAATLSASGKSMSLGCYTTAEEAALVRARRVAQMEAKGEKWHRREQIRPKPRPPPDAAPTAAPAPARPTRRGSDGPLAALDMTPRADILAERRKEAARRREEEEEDDDAPLGEDEGEEDESEGEGESEDGSSEGEAYVETRLCGQVPDFEGGFYGCTLCFGHAGPHALVSDNKRRQRAPARFIPPPANQKTLDPEAMEYDFRPAQEEEVKEEEAPPPSRAGWRLPEPRPRRGRRAKSDDGAPLVALPTPLPRADANAVAAARATRKSRMARWRRCRRCLRSPTPSPPPASAPTAPPNAAAEEAAGRSTGGGGGRQARRCQVDPRPRAAGLRNEIAGKARFAADVQLCGTPGASAPLIARASARLKCPRRAAASARRAPF